MKKERKRQIEPPWNATALTTLGVWYPDLEQWGSIEQLEKSNLPPTDSTAHRHVDIIKDSHDVMHNCTHWKRRLLCTNGRDGAQMSDYFSVLSDKTPFGKSRTVPNNWAYRCTDRSNVPVLSPLQVEKWFSHDAFESKVDVGRSFDPTSDFSIWMLVVDLYQLPKLMKSLWKTLKFHNELRAISFREMANLNLAVQFGLLASFSDIIEFFRIAMTWRAAYDDLRESQDKRRRWRRQRPVPDDLMKTVSPHGDSVRVPIYGIPGLTEGWCKVTAKAVHTRTLRYRITCPELTGWLARVAQFIDAFGVLAPIAAWDRVPWGFVLDWWIPFGNWLQKHTPKVFPLDIVFVDYCESIKYERRLMYSTRHLEGFPLEGPAHGELTSSAYAFEFESIYLRRRYVPPEQMIKQPSIKLVPNISWRRVSIAASLIAQRLPRNLRGIDYRICL